MLRPIIFLIFELLLILHPAQNQRYLECKFDQGAPPCTLQPVGTSPPLDVNSFIILDDSSIDPIMPLSDVTSITELTIGNDSPCLLPYQLDGSSTNLYFCVKTQGSSNLPTCATVDTSIQECEVGQYVISELISTESQTYSIEIIGTRDLSCLSFYYYITRPNVSQIVVRIGDILGSETQEIGQASAVPFNGWHPIEFHFAPNMTNYRVYFDLQRSESSSQPVYIALDEIMIINGRCDSDVVDTTMKTEQTTQTDVQETSSTTSAASFSTTTNLITTESTIVQGSTTTVVPTSNGSIPSTTTPIPLSSEAWSRSSYSSQWETSEKTTATSIPSITSTPAAISTTTTPSQTSTTITKQATTTSPSKSKLPLILGLTLGIGLPVVICIIAFLIYTFRIKKRSPKESAFENKAYIPLK